MKKLRLDWEERRVESFATARIEDAAGTVRAHVGTVVGVSCPAQLCHTDDDTVCGLTQACE